MSDKDFEKIKEIANKFPELPKRERSMIEIGGYRNDENVNSNYLAFFLREKEEHKKAEHNLGRLFFDSLLEVLGLNISDFQGEYEVKREFPTKRGNRIDIVIKSEDWAIIIENKIYHILNNNLDDYWDSIDVKVKKGVILSLQKEHHNYHKNFKNITHEELITKVKENLGQNITTCNPKYAPFLRDFILNVENYYFYERKDVKEAYQNRFLFYLRCENYKEKIKEDIKNDINNVLKRILNYNCFTNDTKKISSYWLYYDESGNFQIFYDTNLIFKNKEISLRFGVKKVYYEANKANFVDNLGTQIDSDYNRLYYKTLTFKEIELGNNYIDFINQNISIFRENKQHTAITYLCTTNTNNSTCLK